MEYKAEKKRFLQSLVNSRVGETDFFLHAREFGVSAPPELLAKWKKRFYTVPAFKYRPEIKTINKFCLGADPEFFFSTGQMGRGADGNEPLYAHCESLGLNTVEAFGADMTGRQAELRAYPDRSALRVVASILTTLRWMPHKYPQTLNYLWMADAFIGSDGVGGHVHFGRKRPNRDVSIKSLDALTALLIFTGCVDSVGSQRRTNSTRYGRAGDIRVQPHGYEYRAMPTWMHSPRAAFITLTLAKLCVFHELKVPVKVLAKESAKNNQQVLSLLRTFAGVDDDARLALYTIEKFGMPIIPQYKDFKGNWGIPTGNTPTADATMRKIYIPPVIKPTDESVSEMWDHIFGGKKLTYYVPKPNWTPFVLVKDIHQIQFAAHRAGLPEIAQGGLSKKFVVSLSLGATGGNPPMTVWCPKGFELDSAAINKACRDRKVKFGKVQVRFQDPSRNTIEIAIPGNIESNYVVDKDVVQDCRWLLYKSGFFPLAKADVVEKLEVEGFSKKKEVKLLGNVVFQIAGMVGS